MGADKKKPNIIFIFIDDQGYYDLGCYGAAEVKTPRIDAMAKAGLKPRAAGAGSGAGVAATGASLTAARRLAGLRVRRRGAAELILC